MNKNYQKKKIPFILMKSIFDNSKKQKTMESFINIKNSRKN